MSVILRLKRMGAKKKPVYRLVATDSHSSRNGKFLETLGHYNPHVQENQIKLDMERIDHWLGTGARLSDTARNLIKRGKESSVAGAPAK